MKEHKDDAVSTVKESTATVDSTTSEEIATEKVKIEVVSDEIVTERGKIEVVSDEFVTEKGKTEVVSGEIVREKGKIEVVSGEIATDRGKIEAVSDEIVTEKSKIEVVSGERDGEETVADSVTVSDGMVVDEGGGVKVDLGDNMGSNGTGDHVMEDAGVVNEGNEGVDGSRVDVSEKDEVAVSEESAKESVEVVKEVVQENVVTTVVQETVVTTVVWENVESELSSKETEAGGGEVEVKESVQNVGDGDRVVDVKSEEETKVISSSNLPESTEGHVTHVVVEEGLAGKDETEDGVDNQGSSNEVVNAGRREDNARESTENTENQAGVDQTMKETVQSTDEATPDDPEKTGDGTEVGESKTVAELERSVVEVAVEQSTVSVQEATDTDCVMTEKDEVLDSEKVPDSVTEVVELVANEGLAEKDETQDDPSEDQRAPCSDKTSLSSEKDESLDSEKIPDSKTEVVEVVAKEGLAEKDETQDGLLEDQKAPCSDKPSLSSEIVDTGNAENLDQNAEVDQMNKESSQSTTEVRTHDTSESVKETEDRDSKMDEKPEIIGMEIDVIDKSDETEVGLEQQVESVEEVADADNHSSKFSHSSIMVSLGLEEEVDVVVVDDGLEGKIEADDSVSVEPTGLVNVATGEIEHKAEADSTSKDGNSIAAIKPDDDIIVQEQPDSDVQVSTDVGILVGIQSKPDVVAYTDQGLNANHSDWGSDITMGGPHTHTDHGVLPATSGFSYEEAHERGEDVGMDIDEVLGWKDEIPSAHEHEPKVDPINLSNFELQEAEAPVSLQQLCYFHPPETEGEFSVSDLVWGKVRSHPWWPGQIFDPSDASEKAMKHHKKDCFLVAYFGDRTFAWNDSTVLKPFRENFSQIVEHTDSEAFNNAVHCALQEVSRRVELGLSCSCISPDIYENIKCQIVENSGIKQESSRRHGVDKSASVNSFEPRMLVDYVRLLSKFPHSAGNKMELTMAKAQLSSYGRFKGYRQLVEFQLCGGLLEAEQVIKDETVSEDGSRKRKALDSVSDDKPSLKVGGSIQNVASQLHGAPEPLSEDTVPMQSLGPAQPGNQADMLSQLHLAAQDPRKGHGFTNNIVPFFNSHRTSVLTKSRLNSPNDGSKKRKTSNEHEQDGFELDDVNDSYWTDRVIQNIPEENLLQETQNQNHNQIQSQIQNQIQSQIQNQIPIQNQNGGAAHHQVVALAYEQEKQQAKPARRSNKKRFFSSNHEIEAKEQSELIERRRRNLATEVLMKFTEGIYFPSEIHLNKMFKRFGPLMESETEVDRQSGRARVVFKKCSDAEVAHSSAGKINIFGSINVTYELNYTPLISYKPLPLSVAQDPPHAC